MMLTNRIDLFSCMFLTLFASGCLAPKYTLYHPMPDTYTHQENADGETENLATWWKQFEDETLNDLIETAIQQNYDLGIALEKIEESRARYRFDRAQLFPLINGIGEINRTQFSKNLRQVSFLTKNELSFYQLGLDAIWEIDIWGRLRYAARAQYYAFKSQIEDMRDVYIILIADVALTYIAIRSLSLQQMLVTELISIEQQLLRLIKDRADAGLDSDIPVTTQEQLVAQTEDRLRTIQTEYAQARHRLAVLLGINPENLFLKDTYDIPLYMADIKVGAPSELLRRRPDIRRAEEIVASTNQSIGRATAGWFPKFTLFGSFTAEANDGSKLFCDDSIAWTIGPSFKWPLLNFGRVNATIHATEAINRQALLRYSQTIISALEEVENFLVAYFSSTEQYQLRESQYQSAQREEKLIHELTTSGLTNQLNLLRAQKNRIQTALTLTIIKQQMSSALVSLYKALGGGW